MTRLLALALVLPLPALAQEAQSIRFECADGTRVDVAYPDAQTAVMEIDDGAPVGLVLTQADEATETPLPRYVGEGVEWRPDGNAAGVLAPLVEGEAAAAGVECVAVVAEAG